MYLKTIKKKKERKESNIDPTIPLLAKYPKETTSLSGRGTRTPNVSTVHCSVIHNS